MERSGLKNAHLERVVSRLLLVFTMRANECDDAFTSREVSRPVSSTIRVITSLSNPKHASQGASSSAIELLLPAADSPFGRSSLIVVGRFPISVLSDFVLNFLSFIPR